MYIGKNTARPANVRAQRVRCRRPQPSRVEGQCPSTRSRQLGDARQHKHLIQGNHDRVKGKLRPYWESIEQYAEVNDENRLVILSHYPILFYKNQHYGAVMLYGHVHNTREWELVEKWKKEQWAMGIPSRLINVGCMMAYMNYTPRTLDELLDVNPMPEIARVRKDGSAVENAEQRNKQEGVWDLNEGYTAEKTE